MIIELGNLSVEDALALKCHFQYGWEALEADQAIQRLRNDLRTVYKDHLFDHIQINSREQDGRVIWLVREWHKPYKAEQYVDPKTGDPIEFQKYFIREKFHENKI